MDRLQLFRTTKMPETSEIGKKIIDRPFNKNSQEGFVLIMKNENSIEASYYCKQVKKIPEMNPYEKRMQDVVFYSKLDFVILNDSSLFYLINPSRDSMYLYDTVAKMLGFEKVFNKYCISINALIELLKVNLSSFSVFRVVIENIPFTNSIYGNLVLKGTDNIYPLLNNYHNYQIKQISAQYLKKDNSLCFFSLTNTGRLTCKSEDRSSLINVLSSNDIAIRNA